MSFTKQLHELDEFLSSDVKNDGAERQMKNEEWRIKVNNEIRLIRVIRCEKQDMRASCEGLRVLVATAQRWMRCSCACMAPVWLATSTGTLNCGAAVVGGEVGRQRDS